MARHSLAPSPLTSDQPHAVRPPDRPSRRIKALLAGAALTLVALAATALIGSLGDTPGSPGTQAHAGGGDDTAVRFVPAPPGQSKLADTAWRGSPSWDRPIRPIPTRVRMPDVGVDAPVIPVGVGANGELGIPDEPRALGWWQQGAHPDGPGAVVIAGHVDTAKDGPGALFRLDQAQVGEFLILETNLGSHRYVVTDIERYAKVDLPALTFTTTGPPHLILITCGGAFNTVTHQYADNVVVSADPA